MRRDQFSFPLKEIELRQAQNKLLPDDMPDCLRYIDHCELVIIAGQKNLEHANLKINELKAKLYDLQNNDT